MRKKAKKAVFVGTVLAIICAGFVFGLVYERQTAEPVIQPVVYKVPTEVLVEVPVVVEGE